VSIIYIHIILINELPFENHEIAPETILAFLAGDIIARHGGVDRLKVLNNTPPFLTLHLVQREINVIATARGTPTFTELQDAARTIRKPTAKIAAKIYAKKHINPHYD